MLAHYLAVALAKFRRTPFTTAANVLTLALGLACFIAAYGIASYWRSADGYHRGAERIFVIGQTILAPGSPAPNAVNTLSAPPLARYLIEDFSEIEVIARAFSRPQSAVSSDEDAKTLANIAYVDPSFLELFTFEFIEGDSISAFAQPDGVVLTSEAAGRLFGAEQALGRAVTVDGASAGTVTAVIAPARQPSFMGGGPNATLRFDILRTLSAGPFANVDRTDNWFGISAMTFARFKPDAAIDAFNARLPAFLANRIPPQQQEAAAVFLGAFPINEMTTHRLDRLLFEQSGADLSAVSVLIGLGFLTLIAACINYANLGAAQTAARTTEIGLRKVLGARGAQVMAQSWLEATLLAAAALLVSLGVLALATPPVRAAIGVDPLYFLSQGVAPVAALGSLCALVGLVAGFYPGVVAARLRPAPALSSGRSRSGRRGVTLALVGVQFGAASFLLILVTVTQLQRTHLELTALAPRGDPIVLLNPLAPLGLDFETLEARLTRIPGVESATVVETPPWSAERTVIRFSRSAEPGANRRSGYLKAVGYDYFDTLNLDLLAGRVFEQGRDTTPASLLDGDPDQTYPVIIDQTYAERLGFSPPESAVGEVIYVPAGSTGGPPRPAQPAYVIGVSAAETMLLQASQVDGRIYFFNPRSPNGGQFPLVRISREDVSAALSAITAAWEELAPDTPIDIRFFDQLFETAYREYARIGQLFALLAGTAFVIASIGLLGMAVQVAGARRHEIGVRKTLGSTTLGIVRLLLVDFSKPVLIANLLAWPLGYLAAQTYLSAFAERAPLTPAPFALSLALTLAIAWAAVIGEVLKAASVRPAEVLRHA